jgi:hypothetical protein
MASTSANDRSIRRAGCCRNQSASGWYFPGIATITESQLAPGSFVAALFIRKRTSAILKFGSPGSKLGVESDQTVGIQELN